MAMEVELKAHVSDPQAVIAALERLDRISPATSEYKEDLYFSEGTGKEPLFRLRIEQTGPDFDSMSGSVILTYKDKSIEDGIEVNSEKEVILPVEQAANAETFFLALGYVPYIRKTKRGYSFHLELEGFSPRLHIELVSVEGLGWFLEMEFLTDRTEDVPVARGHLREVLSWVGIEESAIEPRYYMHMLKDLQG
jgi:adenylate cyclase class 2